MKIKSVKNTLKISVLLFGGLGMSSLGHSFVKTKSTTTDIDVITVVRQYAIGPSGNIYAAGSIGDSTPEGNKIWIAKFNPSLVFIASATYQGPSDSYTNSYIESLVVGPDETIYAVGMASTGPATSGSVSFQDRRIWVGKFDSDMNIIDDRMMTLGTDNETGLDLLLANGGGLYISGNSGLMRNFPSDPPTIRNFFVLKLDQSFNVLHSYSFIAPLDYTQGELAQHPNGTVFVGFNTLDGTSDSVSHIYSLTENLDYIKEVEVNTGDGDEDIISSLVMAPDGNLMAAGSVAGADGMSNSWVASYSPDLQLISQFNSDFGSAVVDGGVTDIFVDSSGNVLGATIGDDSAVLFRLSRSLSVKETHLLYSDDPDGFEPISLFNSGYGRLVVSGRANVNISGGTESISHEEYSFNPTQNPEGPPLAYPNPFRPGKGHTTMSIDNLPESGTLKLFTLKGDLVREIPVTAGSASWDIKNTSGESAKSGVYFGLVDGQDSNKIFKVVVQR